MSHSLQGGNGFPVLFSRATLPRTYFRIQVYIYTVYIYTVYIYTVYIYCIYISDGLFQIVTNTWLTSETQQKTSLLAFGRIAPFLQRIQPFKPTNHQPVSATGRDAVVGAWNMDRMRNLLPGLQKKLGNLTWTVNYHPNHSLGLDYLKSMACLQEIVVTTDCTIWYGVLSEIKDLLPRCEILESHSLSHEMFFFGFQCWDHRNRLGVRNISEPTSRPKIRSAYYGNSRAQQPRCKCSGFSTATACCAAKS